MKTVITPHNLQRLLKDALAYCQNNQFNEGKNIYLEIIKVLPNHPEALSNIGTIELQQGNISEGVNYIKRSLNINPDQSHAISNLGNALLEINKHEEAIEAFNSAIRLDPNNSEIYYNKGRALRFLNKIDESLDSYCEAIKINSNNYLALNNRAYIYNILSKYELAIIDLNKAIKLNQNFPEAFLNRGISLNGLKNYQDAITSFNSAIELNPAYSEAYSKRGISMNALNEYELAIESFNQAILYDPTFPEAYNGRGSSFYNLENFIKAIENFNKAIELDPNYYEAIINKGVILYEEKKYDAALELFEKAIYLKPEECEGYVNKAQVFTDLDMSEEALLEYEKAFNLSNIAPVVYYNASLLFLKNKDFEKGWKFYEKRVELEKYKNNSFHNDKEKLVNSEIMNKVIFIDNEQGVGDQILFMSMIRELDVNKNRLIVRGDSRLITLFKRSFPNIEFFPYEIMPDKIKYDFYSLSGSLGKILRKSIDSFKNQPSEYLRSNQLLTNKLRNKLKESNKIICGLAWKSASKKVGIHKSVSLEDYLPIFKLDKLHFIDLQYGETQLEKKSIFDRYGILVNKIDEIDTYNDIDGLASLIDSCDLIITTSNVTAHIAGALGKDVYLILPVGKARLWYWHNGDKNNLWYPSIKQFALSLQKETTEVIEEISRIIKEKYCD
jgi:hypothetical protein